MTAEAERLLEQILRLPSDDVRELAHELRERLDPESFDDLHPEWDEEIRRRVEEMDSGKQKGIPWDAARRMILGEIPMEPGDGNGHVSP